MEFLKNVLGERYEEFKAYIDKYNAENKDSAIKLADLSKGEYVSKAKYESLEIEKKGIEEQLKTANSTLDTLKRENKDNEELQKKINELTEANKNAEEKYKAEVEELKINAAIDTALIQAKAKTLKAVKAMMDMSAVKLDKEGKVSGIEEQIKALSENEDTKYLFEEQQQFRGARVGISDGVVESDTSKMTYSEMCAYLEKNPSAKI